MPRFVSALVAIAVVTPLSAQSSPDPYVMFRGEATHAGVSSARMFAGQGGIRWSTRLGGAVRSSPAVHRDRLFVGSNDGNLVAIERASGRIVWKAPAGSPVSSSPAVARGLVIVGALDGRLIAVDESTGKLRWTAETGPTVPGNSHNPVAFEYFTSSPAVSGSTVVIGGRDGAVHAFDLLTGKRRWRILTGGRVSASPAISENTVVVGSFDGIVYALDLATGRTKWTFRTKGADNDPIKARYDNKGIQGSAAIVGGSVFVGGRDDGLYGLDFATGTQRWRFSHRGSWVVGSPAVDGQGRVFVGSSDGQFIQALNAATGEEVWRLGTKANTQASPIRIGDQLVAATYNPRAATGEILVLDAGTGAVRWKLRLDGSIISTPAIVDGEIYVGTDAGSVVAIHEVSRTPVHLAVYSDSGLPGRPFTSGAQLGIEYFRELGYRVLGPDSLRTFLEARVGDQAPSAVVFPTEHLPAELVANPETSAIRRYLEAGGKIVSLGLPLGVLGRDSTGKPVAYDFGKSSRLLGIVYDSVDFNELAGTPTAEGKAWGIEGMLQGTYLVGAGPGTIQLSRSHYGTAPAWVKTFRADRPGSGFVHLWGMGSSVERLAQVRAVAEYGLLRKATP